MSSSVLLLVDAMAVVYRAFYAIRDLSTSSGEPTNALFGFIRMFRQMLEWWKPTHLAVVFDAGLPEERMLLLEEYKAQRPPMPDALAVQIPLIEEFLALSGAPTVRVEGQEADDVMASLARWAEPQCESVLLASSDKDLFQLVNDRVNMASVSGRQSLMGPSEVEAKTGVAPDRIVEWLALVGDNADNIPGVPGVGPKTAAKLLAQFASLDAMWRGLEQVSGDKLRTSLAGSRATVERNLGVVRLRTNLETGIDDWSGLCPGAESLTGLYEFFKKVEFTSFANEIRQPDLFG